MNGMRFYCADCGSYGTSLAVPGLIGTGNLPETCVACGSRHIVEPGHERDLRDWPPFVLAPEPGLMNAYGRMN